MMKRDDIFRGQFEVADPTASFSPEKISELHERERALLYRIDQYKKAVRQAAEEYAPYLVAQYVYDLAKDYNGFYQEISIFNEDDEDLMKMRVLLSKATAEIIKRGMDLLGIGVPERM